MPTFAKVPPPAVRQPGGAEAGCPWCSNGRARRRLHPGDAWVPPWVLLSPCHRRLPCRNALCTRRSTFRPARRPARHETPRGRRRPRRRLRRRPLRRTAPSRYASRSRHPRAHAELTPSSASRSRPSRSRHRRAHAASHVDSVSSPNLPHAGPRLTNLSSRSRRSTRRLCLPSPRRRDPRPGRRRGRH